MWIIAPLLCGLIFGAGLLISGMVQPTKVLAFLDIFGAWDPSLAVVMVAALAVSVPGFMLAGRRERPWLAGQYFLPGKSEIDLPLITGAGLFGIGWGLVGLCPGPALESLATLSLGVVVFVVAMAAGMITHDAWQQARLTAQRERLLVSATDG
ncbi:YeeE/YedE family protein [Bradyrhizobium sp. WSM 1738]|uniref:DUF6691 family protein n=1 Tax=Bradyrhizobium hereditatis TaxID=2821405 RepID=UPI001CE347E6|nr:DUF6691 family protein [Bradyrhizobium hereditatis]MCA6114471.1 YeeE/YedE family protein [Bradyrhizobium hereditatis]